MYWELRKKMPEIIEKATQQAVAEALAETVPKAVETALAEAVPKAVETAVVETRQTERERFKRFCEKHGITYTEEDWADETLDSENE